MTLRGSVGEFPLETIIQLLAATGKTGLLEIRGDDAHHGKLGISEGRLVSASIGDDSGEPALGAIFSLERGDFEFIPWNEAPARNLDGELDSLLDRAVSERDRLVGIREVIPSDQQRFKLSERATATGEIRMSPEQWRTLLAINGERDVNGVARQLGTGRLATLSVLADLVRAGFVDVLEPLAEPAPPAVRWAEPVTAPEPQRSWEAPAPAPQWAPAEPEPVEPADPRAALMAAAFPSAPAAPAAPAPPEPATDPRLAAMAQPAAPTWTPPSAPVSTPAPLDAQESQKRESQKRGGLFGLGGKKDEPASGAGLEERTPSGRAVQLSTLANALMSEFASGKYGKNKTEERLGTLLMRVDEQADPIDRPLPIVDDRIDVDALGRGMVPEEQSVPYLAVLVSQIYTDAERAFGRDKAKKGYKTAQMQVFGTESAAVLRSPDLAERLPKV